jgi:hypothetical protein
VSDEKNGAVHHPKVKELYGLSLKNFMMVEKFGD